MAGRLEQAWETTRNVGNTIQRASWWTAYAAGRVATSAIALVPAAAAVTELANAYTRATRGYDVAPSLFEQAHGTLDPMLSGPAPDQAVALGGQAALASAEIGDAVAGWGGDVVGVVASHSGAQEAGMNTIGRTMAHMAVAGAAGYGAYRAARLSPIPHPPQAAVQPVSPVASVQVLPVVQRPAA